MENLIDVLSGCKVISNETIDDFTIITFSPVSYGPLQVHITLKLKNTEEDWSCSVISKLIVFGKTIWETDRLELSPTLSYIHLTPKTPLGTTRFNIYLGVRERTVYIKFNVENILLGQTSYVDQNIYTF